MLLSFFNSQIWLRHFSIAETVLHFHRRIPIYNVVQTVAERIARNLVMYEGRLITNHINFHQFQNYSKS
jgi:hypothetical protein